MAGLTIGQAVVKAETDNKDGFGAMARRYVSRFSGMTFSDHIQADEALVNLFRSALTELARRDAEMIKTLEAENSKLRDRVSRPYVARAPKIN